MKILRSRFSPATTHFHPPISDTPCQCHRILSIKTPSTSTSSGSSLKTRFHRRQDYNTLLIPKPVAKSPRKQRIVGVDVDSDADADLNTSSDVLRLMDGLRLNVTPDIYASLVAECTRNRDAGQAEEVLAHLRRNRGMVGFVNGSSGLPLLNRILLMFVVCGSLDVALQVFDKMPQRDSISLAIVIAGLVNDEQFGQALELFVRMYGRISTDKYCELPLQLVMVCVLEACGQVKDIDLGQVVHGLMVKMGFSGELLVATVLMEFYGRCGCLPEANLVFFDQIGMEDRCDSKIWNVAMVNNCRQLCFDEVVWIFREMGRAGVRKNNQTFSNVLKACGRASNGESYGKQVHANAIKLALDTRVSVMCSLVDMYGKRGLLNDARKVFDLIACEERSMACWNAMVTGFMNHGLQIEAIKSLYEMKAAGVEPQQSLIEELVVAFGSEKLSICTSNGSILEQENGQ